MNPEVWQIDDMEVVYRAWLRAPFRALSGASLVLREGERLGLVGPSGGGKSSLVKAGLGLVRPASGIVRWFGQDTRSWSTGDWRQLRARVQWLPQRSEALLHPRMSVRDQMLVTARHHRRSEHHVDDYLARLGIEHRASALPHELSGGERRRAALARVLLPEPMVLVADEPTSGLDAERRHDVLQQVLTVPDGGARMVVGHDIAALTAQCDRLVVVVGGRVVATVDAAELREGQYQPEDPSFVEILSASGYTRA